MWCRAQRKGRPTWLVSKTWSFSTVCENWRWKRPVTAEKSFSKKSIFNGLNYGSLFRHLWTKVHQIMSADAGEIAVCNIVFRLSISCSVPEIFAIEVRSRPKSRQKACFSAPNFFGGGPQILDPFFKIAPISDHVAKFRGDRPRDRGDLVLNKKKEKKETAAKH